MPLQIGDVFLNETYHTEMLVGYYANGIGKNVGAHDDFNGVSGDSDVNNDGIGDEIDFGEYTEYTSVHPWEYILRAKTHYYDLLQKPTFEDEFYAFIELNNTVLTYDNSLYCAEETGEPKQVFRFSKQNNNLYTISNGSYSGNYNLYKDDTGAIILHEAGSESSCLTSVSGTVINTEYDSRSEEQHFRIRPVSDPILVTYDYFGTECPIRKEHYNSAYSSAFDLVITGFKGWSTTPNGEIIDTSRVLIPYDHTLYAIIDESIKPTVEEETTSGHNAGNGRHDGEGRADAQSTTNEVAIAEEINTHRDDIYNPALVTEPTVQDTRTTEPVTERMSVITDNTNQNEFNTPYSGSSNEIRMPQHNESSANINWIPGYNIGWKLEGDVFTITGNGEMPYYFNPSDAPWISVGPNVRKVVIEEGVTTVGGQAFTYFKNMKEVTLPSTIKVIGRYAFQTTPIQSISLPSGLERIEQGAFAACKNLTSITIPNSVYDLETFTFSECNSLSSVSLSTSLTSIGDGTFERCTSLRTLVIPSGVNCIGAYAFWACNMDAIYIPKSLKTVGYGGFFDSEIRNIYYGGSENEWKNIDVHNTRNGSLKNATIYYDSNC